MRALRPALLLLGLASALVQAAAAKPPVSEDPFTAVQTISAAHALVRRGDADEDPLALITAARMLQRAGIQARTDVGHAAIDEDPWAVPSVLSRARALAHDRSDLTHLIEDTERLPARPSRPALRRWRQSIEADQQQGFTLTPRGTGPLAVAVSGNGESVLSLRVLDPRGRVVCRDDSHEVDLLCRWQPRRSTVYRVEVGNQGGANHYVVVHN